MNNFTLKIFAADRVFYQGLCSSLVIPTVEGQYGIMTNHESMIIAVSIGMAGFTDGDGNRRSAVLSSGICKIEDNAVLVLVETAESPEEIDIRLAERDAAEANEALRNRDNVSDVKRAEAKMARAALRIRAKERSEID